MDMAFHTGPLAKVFLLPEYGNSWEQRSSSAVSRCTASSAGARSWSAQATRTREAPAVTLNHVRALPTKTSMSHSD
jgi:hypothetical protein